MMMMTMTMMMMKMLLLLLLTFAAAILHQAGFDARMSLSQSDDDDDDDDDEESRRDPAYRLEAGSRARSMKWSLTFCYGCLICCNDDDDADLNAFEWRNQFFQIS